MWYEKPCSSSFCVQMFYIIQELNSESAEKAKTCTIKKKLGCVEPMRKVYGIILACEASIVPKPDLRTKTGNKQRVLGGTCK
jgi:hypothetical protein